MHKQEGNGPIDSRAKLMDSDCKFDFIFEINNLRYPNIYMHVASNSPSDGPRGHGGLQIASMTSEFILDIRFEIGNLSYPHTHAHVIH